MMISLALSVAFILFQTTHAQTCKQDLLFLVDVSNQVTANDRNVIRNAIVDYAQRNNFGNTGSINQLSLGVISFGQTASVDYQLQLGQGINNLRQVLDNSNGFAQANGNTRRLDIAVARALEQFAGNQARGDAVPVVIVILSGNLPQTSERQIRSIVEPLRNTGVLVQVVSIGNQVNGADWLASWPSNQYVLRVNSANDLISVFIGNEQRLCSQAGRCSNQDVSFVMDSSGSINAEGFEQIKRFVNTFSRQVEYTRNGVLNARTGSVMYSTEAQTVSQFTSNRPGFIAAITNAPFSNHRTNLAIALRVLNTTVLNTLRTNVANTVVVMTDGWFNEQQEETRPNADSLKTYRNARIVTLGLNYDLRLPDINAVTSAPLYFNRILLSNAAALNTNFREIYHRICPVGTSLNTNPIPADTSRFSGSMDVAIVLSNPATLLDSEYTILRDSVANLVSLFDLGNTRISFTTLANTATTRFFFNTIPIDVNYRQQIDNQIRQAGRSAQAGNSMSAALNQLRFVFDAVQGARNNVPRLVIFITSTPYDPNFIGTNNFNIALQQLTAVNVQVMAVGIGAQAPITQFQDLVPVQLRGEFLISMPSLTGFSTLGFGRIAGLARFNAITARGAALFTCTFDNTVNGAFDLCAIQQDSSSTLVWNRDQFDFTAGSGNSLASRGTGPSSAFSGNNYLVANSQQVAAGDIASVLFPELRVNNQVLNQRYVCARMYLLMNGAASHVGTLQVFIRRDGRDWAVYSRTGVKGSQWLVMYAEAFLVAGDRLGFKAVMRGGINGDIAVENISVFDGRCPFDI